MKIIFFLVGILTCISTASIADESIVYCNFGGLPEMKLTIRGGMGASDNSLQIGNFEPVSLGVGSGLMSASFNDKSYTISWDYPASVTISESNGYYTRFGGCSSDSSVSEDAENPIGEEQEPLVLWFQRSICSAAMMTYFFLENPPFLIGQNDELFDFVSEAGNEYSCLITGETVLFGWTNNSGEEMLSRSTKYTFEDSNLIITSDMQTKIFRSPN